MNPKNITYTYNNSGYILKYKGRIIGGVCAPGSPKLKKLAQEQKKKILAGDIAKVQKELIEGIERRIDHDKNKK